MVTKILKLSEIKAADYNPRKNLKPEDEEYKSLKRSIETFGFVEPLIVNERTMTIVGGHQRYKILRDLGIGETEAVIVNLTPNDEKTLNVALNKIESDWDIDKLSNLFEELKLEDLSVTGFNAAELENFFDNIIEEIPPTPEIKSSPLRKTNQKGEQTSNEKFTIYLSFKTQDAALDWLEERGLEGMFNRGRTLLIDMRGREAEQSATD